MGDNMIASLAYLLLFLSFGMLSVRFLLPKHKPLNRIWLGLSFGVLLEMWLPALCAFFLGFTAAAHGAAAGVLLLLTLLFKQCLTPLFLLFGLLPGFLFGLLAGLFLSLSAGFFLGLLLGLLLFLLSLESLLLGKELLKILFKGFLLGNIILLIGHECLLVRFKLIDHCGALQVKVVQLVSLRLMLFLL
jgi:hypothetical protein